MRKNSAQMEALVVDDEVGMRAVVGDLLAQMHYDVVTARNGREALERIASRRPDIILLDVEMPEVNGWEVLAKIKSDASLRHLPVLILTINSDIPSKVRALELGANDYITKPFDPRELIARVNGAVKTVRSDIEANPLSLLPGNPSIRRALEKCMRSGAVFAVLYPDLNNFKALNDRYGFDRGDKAIRRVAELLIEARRPGDFIGHIGGDDFVIITAPERAERMSRKIIADFNGYAPALYDPEDSRRGYIEVPDRTGREMRFPIVTIAIGGVTNINQPLTSIGQISALGAEMKKFAKRASDGYALDRRANAPRKFAHLEADYGAEVRDLDVALDLWEDQGGSIG